MPVKLVIIGGVAGGATAAARARRLDEKAEIVLFERGEYISFANCGLPYYLGGVIKERDALLVVTAENFIKRYQVDVRVGQGVIELDAGSKKIRVRDLSSGREYLESYDKLILSPGAAPLRPPLEGIDAPNIFNLRHIPDSESIKAYIETRRPRRAMVVGGGFVGLETAENLARHGLEVTILERLDQVMPQFDPEMGGFLHRHLKDKGVRLLLGEAVKSFSRNGGGLAVHTSRERRLEADLVIMSIGLRPESVLAERAGLKLGPRGHILVDQTMRTSDPDIFAVGDAVQVRDFVTGLPTATPLAGPANKQGRIAADNALGRKSIFKGTLGTSIVKVFDLIAAVTGPSQKVLMAHDIPHLISYTHSYSHAGYYPGAQVMALKLIFSPGSGRLLGAQIVGQEGVDKRIDVLATAIRAGMSVEDLEELELAYAPPFSAAKDPINIAGFVAANLLKGDLGVVNTFELKKLDPKETVLIDLRDQDEIEKNGGIQPARHIPLPELRARLGELDRSKDYVLYCAVGLRGYLGYRIMVQNGFKVRNLAGGFKTCLGAQNETAADLPASSWRFVCAG